MNQQFLMEQDNFNYFNFLFCTPTNLTRIKKLHNIILRHRSINGTFNPHLHCSVEDFIVDVTQPLSLKQLSLKFLHLNLAYKQRISTDLLFVNYLNVPQTIEKLWIPLTLRQELLYLYVNCPAHCCLVAKKRLNQPCYRFKLRKHSNLYRLLNISPHWQSRFNKKSYSIPRLMNLVRKLQISGIPNSEYHKINNFNLMILNT